MIFGLKLKFDKKKDYVVLIKWCEMRDFGCEMQKNADGKE